jgi:dipeptidyl aminopeptidase/acylaminoacyl peptidase
MWQDVRNTEAYREAELIQNSIRRPGEGLISDAAEIHASPDGTEAVFAGALLEKLEGKPVTRICRVDLRSGQINVLTSGPNSDRLPRFSPDGRQIAYLSDQHATGDFQLYLIESSSGAARAAPVVDGWVEYLHWSPDGRFVLLGVAGHGADLAGAQGAVTTRRTQDDSSQWMPAVEDGDEQCQWRSIWIYDVAAHSARQVSAHTLNVWEAAWCGTGAIVAIVSDGPGEGFWYTANLSLIDTHTGRARTLYRPAAQLGLPAGSPAGDRVAVVEAICSDRGVVAGDLRIVDTFGTVLPVKTRGVDISYTEWRSNRELPLAGHRGLESVVGLFDLASGEFIEKWSSSELSTGGRHATIAGLPPAGDCVLVGEDYVRAPEIAVVRSGSYRAVRSLDIGFNTLRDCVQHVERVSWNAPDGVEIQGWLLSPAGAAPHPVVMAIHGGPVAHWRPAWLGRPGFLWALMMLRRGYGLFFPNPRGSSGRGQSFARQIMGDMGGADTSDFLSGIDHLVERGLADPRRLGVTGGSYGGYMTLWLVTQDSRFAAAVASSPISNYVTEHLLSNIPHFVALFLADEYTNPTGKYFHRSPIMHAQKVRTPTLISCGALDRCTPREEAAQCHSALREHGTESVLLTYPLEGHGVRNFPAVLDFAARVVTWFDDHMGTGGKPVDRFR